MSKKPPPAEARIVEEEINLVQRLFFASSHARTIVFAGIEHGNGCSRICIRAAEILASQRAGKVCVVDANLRSPFVHTHFGVPQSPGFSDALDCSDAMSTFIQFSPFSNARILASGCSRPNQVSLLTSKLGTRLRELEAQFEFVLIDAPPTSLYADAALLGQRADGVVLVVEAHATRRETALQARRQLERAGVRLLGAVLNKRTFAVPESIYRRL
jgi:capsular exopolysaccharide synthesis family protein